MQESKLKKMYQNGCHLRTISQNHNIFDVHMLGTHVHIYTKYEVSMFLWLGGLYTDNNDADVDANNDYDDNRQSMIVKGSLVDKPNEPKTLLSKQIPAGFGKQ